MNKELRTICYLAIVVVGFALAVRINILFGLKPNEAGGIVPLIVFDASSMLFGAFSLSISWFESKKCNSFLIIPLSIFAVIAIVLLAGFDIYKYSPSSCPVFVILGGAILCMFRWVNKHQDEHQDKPQG